MKNKVIVQVWDHGIEYSDLVARISLDKDKVKKFTRKINRYFSYSIEEEKPVIDGKEWYSKRMKDRRNRNRRRKYWRITHPEEAKSNDILGRFYLSSMLKAAVPSKIFDNVSKASSDDTKKKGTIKFRRYKDE